MDEHEFDVAILGSGITGSTLAAILARNGVLLVEQGVHPRFAIGESTAPETTFLFRVLAARYGVPELANLSTYTKLRRNVATTCGVKRGFSFAFHREGHAHQPTECSQMPTPSPPLGPDMHLFRQDVDGYLLGVAASYGATVRQQTDVTEVRIDDGVRLKSRAGELFRCAHVIDAGGIKSPLASAYGLRTEPCPLRTTSRALYTHMIGVKPFDAVTASPVVHGLPSALSQGTLHHIFEGGWLWVIPFDNHPASSNRLCSVGLMLDPRVHPPTGLPPEQEFRTFIARFPSIAEQFLNAKAMRAWVSTERLQFSSTSLVGDRYCLLPHAHVDPHAVVAALPPHCGQAQPVGMRDASDHPRRPKGLTLATRKQRYICEAETAKCGTRAMPTPSEFEPPFCDGRRDQRLLLGEQRRPWLSRVTPFDSKVVRKNVIEHRLARALPVYHRSSVANCRA